MRALALSVAVFSIACTTGQAETPPAAAEAEQQEISLNHVGAGLRIMSICPGCSSEVIPPTLRPLRGERRNGNALWALSDEYIYVYEETCEAIVVPRGFVTDLASIPPIGRVRHNPANFAEAALVHDWLYAIGQPGRREKVDRVFGEALAATGHADVANELFNFVRLGGGAGYGLPGDYAFWDERTRKMAPPRSRPPTGFKTINQLVNGGSATIAERFGIDPGEDVAAYFRSQCERRQN
jgi:Protein of unknown function (DUF1353)